MRANVNKPSDANIYHANDSVKVKSMPERKFPTTSWDFFSLFAPFGPLGLIIVRHFPNAWNAAVW